MALLECRFASTTLGSQAAITVVLPDAGIDLPVLYLLHGRGDDHSAWVRQTAIERYAEQHGLAVVMPDARLSYYRDEMHGQRYWSYLADELPGVCARLFPLSTRRADTFVAGLSMGGYGALHWALRRPATFAAAASMSGQLDVAAVRRDDSDDPDRARIWDSVFGDADLHGTDADLLQLITRHRPEDLPALWVGCGLEDPMRRASEAFVGAARVTGVAVDYETAPGGHEWQYWDGAIRRVLDWFPIDR